MKTFKKFWAWLILPSKYEDQPISIAPTIVTYFMVGFFASFVPVSTPLWLTIIFAFMIAIPASNFINAVYETDKKFLK